MIIILFLKLVPYVQVWNDSFKRKYSDKWCVKLRISKCYYSDKINKHTYY